MKKRSVFLGLAALPGLVFAQLSVIDPDVPVPAVLYRSVFADTPTGVETQAVDWKAANAEVGQFKNGHVDILKWEAAQPESKPRNSMPNMQHPARAPAPAVAPSVPKP